MTRVALLLLALSLLVPASRHTPPAANTSDRTPVRDALAQTKDFPGVTGKITLDGNRNAQVPVYMLRIEKGGKFTLQEQSSTR